MFFNDKVRREQYYQDVNKQRDRLQKTAPNIPQMVLTDLGRMKLNKIHERQLNRDLTGPRGLNWQCRHELQRLESSERDLKRLSLDLTKMTSPRSLSHSWIFSQKHTPRLSSIVEENASLPMIEKSKLVRERSLSNQFKPIQPRSSMRNMHSNNERTHPFYKQYFQRVIAKTSDDRRCLQQQTHKMNQHKRLIEHKLK